MLWPGWDVCNIWDLLPDLGGIPAEAAVWVAALAGDDWVASAPCGQVIAALGDERLCSAAGEGVGALQDDGPAAGEGVGALLDDGPAAGEGVGALLGDGPAASEGVGALLVEGAVAGKPSAAVVNDIKPFCAAGE